MKQVVNDIYSGRVIFSIKAANRSMLADNYKPRAIRIYDCRASPFIDHYRFMTILNLSRPASLTFTLRLRVPKYGAILEFFNFSILLLTFVLCLSSTHIYTLPIVAVLMTRTSCRSRHGQANPLGNCLHHLSLCIYSGRIHRLERTWMDKCVLHSVAYWKEMIS